MGNGLLRCRLIQDGVAVLITPKSFLIADHRHVSEPDSVICPTHRPTNPMPPHSGHCAGAISSRVQVNNTTHCMHL